MAKTINSDLIRGNINTIILKALYDGDRYGYDIIKEIEIKSHGQYILKQPTLYSCLKRLETQGFIEAYWGEQTSNGGRRKYYRLTEEGKEIFKQSQDEYEYSRTVIDNLISDNQYDLSTLTPLENTEKDDENEIVEPQQLSMDVSSLEVVSTEPEKTEEPIKETATTAVEETVNETVNEYVEPAPVFMETTEVEEPTKETPIEIAQEQTTEIVEEHHDLPQINNSEYINSLLSQNQGSYFGRDESVEISEKPANNTNYAQTTDDFDDIEKRLAALKASYDKEVAQSKEYQPQQPYVAPKSDYTPKPIFVQKSDMSSHQTKTNDSSENYENGFFKYNVQHSGITSQEEEQPVVYRSLSSLMETDSTPTQAPQDLPKPKPVSIKEQIRIRNFGKLSESIEELGENVKLRPHYDSKHDYKKQYYYRDSYLRLFHFGIMFVLTLLEVFGAYVLGKQLIGANTSYDIPFYIISIIACFILPVSAAAIYLYHPSSKKRNDYNLKSSLIFRVIVTIQLLLIIYALNIWMGMPITFDGKYFITLALPIIFAINFPISALVFNSLRKKEKFALKE